MNFETIRHWALQHQAPLLDALAILGIAVAVLVANHVLSRLFASLTRHRKAHGRLWAEALFRSLYPPMGLALWITGATIAMGYLGGIEKSRLAAQIFPPARDLGAIITGAWFCMRLITNAERAFDRHCQRAGRNVDPTAADAIGKLLRAVIIIIAIMMTMPALGFSISGILAFGGIGGIAVGFAAQGLVANLFGGLTVYASRPFKVGDWIIMPDNNITGGVEAIGWRATRVMGFDRQPIYVPNALFNTAVVINNSRMSARKIEETIHLRYDDIDKVPAITRACNALLADYPGIERNSFLFRMNSCGDFALNLYFYAFTLTTNYGEYMVIKEDILLKIGAIIREQGAEIAVPTTTVHLKEGAHPQGGAPLQGGPAPIPSSSASSAPG